MFAVDEKVKLLKARDCERIRHKVIGNAKWTLYVGASFTVYIPLSLTEI